MDQIRKNRRKIVTNYNRDIIPGLRCAVCGYFVETLARLRNDGCPRCGTSWATRPPLQAELHPRQITVAELLARSESQHFDFKEHLEPSYYDKLAKHICAFANAEGGEIFIGVRNEPRYFIGLFGVGDEATAADYTNRLQQVIAKIKPRPIVAAPLFVPEPQSRQVGMLIVVSPGPATNYAANGKIYVRQDDKSVPISQYEADQRLRQAKRGRR